MILDLDDAGCGGLFAVEFAALTRRFRYVVTLEHVLLFTMMLIYVMIVYIIM